MIKITLNIISNLIFVRIYYQINQQFISLSKKLAK